MSAPKPIIALVDLFDSPEEVSRAALSLAGRNAAEVRYVALFDHVTGAAPRAGEQGKESPGERFHRIEAELLARLRGHVAGMGVRDAVCAIISGPSGEELGRLAASWNAGLVLTDFATARAINNGWVPWLSPVTRLPCQLYVVPGGRRRSWPWLLSLLAWIRAPRPRDC